MNWKQNISINFSFKESRSNPPEIFESNFLNWFLKDEKKNSNTSDLSQMSRTFESNTTSLNKFSFRCCFWPERDACLNPKINSCSLSITRRTCLVRNDSILERISNGNPDRTCGRACSSGLYLRILSRYDLILPWGGCRLGILLFPCFPRSLSWFQRLSSF